MRSSMVNELEIYVNLENHLSPLEDNIENEFFQLASNVTAIEPPPEFQDEPDNPVLNPIVEKFAFDLTSCIISFVLKELREHHAKRLNQDQQKSHKIAKDKMKRKKCLNYSSSYKISELRPNSIVAPIARQHFSSSHDSLLMSMHKFNDDSTSYIKQAVSHDVIYNVPFDSCLDDFSTYAVPIESQYKKCNNIKKKKRKRYSSMAKSTNLGAYPNKDPYSFKESKKRYSLAGTSSSNSVEPIHMTLEEVRNYLHDLYSGSSSDTSERPGRKVTPPIEAYSKNFDYCNNNNNNKLINNVRNRTNNNYSSCDQMTNGDFVIKNSNDIDKKRKLNAKFSMIKRALCGIFKFKRKPPNGVKLHGEKEGLNNLVARALPPLPTTKIDMNNGGELKIDDAEQILDFATSIQKVKDCGWYWGPISSEAAEKILSNEPDGSFIVRDSSDDHYIFSLTFKLNDFVRHVRIDHDQGNFSFGSCTRFKSQTIVEFIENAVEHSRSGRYLFFLHRRPVIGPVRVQLLHPVSRFKQIQSLQHMCRFVIHKMVRRDLIPTLPLPRRMIDYLNTPHYYSENLEEIEDGADSETNGFVHS